MKRRIALTVNGSKHEVAIEPRQSLLQVLREELHLTGTKEGCSEGECSACTVMLDGQIVDSCLIFGLEAHEREVVTIEGLGSDEALHPVQQAFVTYGGTQCGFCTPGMILAAKALLDRHPNPTDEEIRWGISGNLCRCTGYVKIVDAIKAAAADRRAQAGRMTGRVVGVVLAAGESRRMGRLKALLPFGERTVIEQVIQPLLQADLARVAVVLGHRAAEIEAVLHDLPIHFLYNADYRQGMTTSVQVAMRGMTPIPDGYLLALVDQPHLGMTPVAQVLAAFRQTGKGIVIPTWQGKRGHPIVLSSRYRQAVLALGHEQGLNLVTRAHPDDTLEVPLQDDAILRDMDYQEEYEAELQRWLQRPAS